MREQCFAGDSKFETEGETKGIEESARERASKNGGDCTAGAGAFERGASNPIVQPAHPHVLSVSTPCALSRPLTAICDAPTGQPLYPGRWDLTLSQMMSCKSCAANCSLA